MTPSPTPPQSIWKLSARHSTSPRPPEPPNNLPGSPPPDPFPPEPMPYLRWLLQILADADGYIPAASQETCLQLYGGLPFAAALDRQANLFRAPPTPDPAPAPAFTTAIPSPSIPPFGPPTPTDPPKHPRPRTRQSPCFPPTPPHDRY